MSVFLKDAFDSYISDNYKNAVLSAMSVAEKYCIKIFLIGGIVRDLILNNPVKDIDIAVECDAVEFCKILEKEIPCKIISTQENLRTAKVQFKNSAEIDFASTREEKYTQPGILPVAYNFGCPLKFDVKRRDFTINTLALDLTSTDKFYVIDYFDGFKDIQNKKLKVLHNKSFIDDPSRIIRLLKFQTRFNFDIEENTLTLMNEYLNDINIDIPLERIKNELKQYFSLNKSELYNRIIETKSYKLLSDKPVLNFDENTLKELSSYNLFNNEDLWFIYFILLTVNCDYSKMKLNLTSLENKIIKEVKSLLNDFSVNINDNNLIYKKFSNKHNISIAAYYVITKDKSVNIFLDKLKQIKIQITGNDLINIGFTPSAYFNELFDIILKEKIQGNLKNKEEEVEFIKNFLKKEE